MRTLAVLVVSSTLLAQGVSPGLRTGVAVTPLLTAEGPQHTSASRFTIGPCIEIHLWRDAALGVDFLLRRTDLAISAAARRAEIWEWEVPGTIIYRFRPPARPFVRTGISFNRVFDISGATECALGPFGERFYCLDGSLFAELRHRGTSGFVLGGGLRLRMNKLWLEPEVRLTHWMDRNFGVRDSAVRSDLNQIGFLVGVIF
jgi:hypothetical protein